MLFIAKLVSTNVQRGNRIPVKCHIMCRRCMWGKKYLFLNVLKRLINFIFFSLQITQTTKRLKRQLLREEWCNPPPNTHVHCLVLQALLKQLLPGWAQHRWYRVARQIIVIRARPLQIQTHCGVTLVKRDRYYQANKVVQAYFIPCIIKLDILTLKTLKNKQKN